MTLHYRNFPIGTSGHDMTQVHPGINIGLQYIRNISEIHSEATYTSTVPSKFIVPSIYIPHATYMTKEELVAKRLVKLMGIEESCFMAEYHATMEKGR